MTSILIQNGTIVNATGETQADLYIEDGIIREIGVGIRPPHVTTHVIDANDTHLFPGGIDPHVHLDLQVGSLCSSDNFESGSAAALMGGTTSFIDFVTPQKGHSMIDALRDRMNDARDALCDYSFHQSVTHFGPTTAAEMERCVRDEGISSFKTYLAYKSSIGIEDHELISAMTVASHLNALITAHCEHGDMVTAMQNLLVSAGKTSPRFHAQSRPPEVEGEAVHRAAMMAHMTHCELYVVHASTKDAIDAIRSHSEKIWAETCPQYLVLDESSYEGPFEKTSAFVMSPPLRPSLHREALWQAIDEGLIQTIGTDHCPFMASEKALGRNDFRRIPNGAGGIQHRLAVIYTEGVVKRGLSLSRFVDLTSTASAKRFGLYPRKGALCVGSDADVVIWDRHLRSRISAAAHHHRNDQSIYEGMETQGGPRMVIQRGEIAVQDGTCMVDRGRGLFLKRRVN